MMDDDTSSHTKNENTEQKTYNHFHVTVLVTYTSEGKML